MKKQATFISIVSFALAIIFFGQLVTVSAWEKLEKVPTPEPTQICAFNDESAEEGGQFYFSEDGECLQAPILLGDGDARVPTSIQLISSGTESRDPVSTLGTIVIFFILIALTVFWLATIKKWNGHSG